MSEEEERESRDDGSDAEDDAVCDEALETLADVALVDVLLAVGCRRRRM